jgi:hypothetical protein
MKKTNILLAAAVLAGTAIAPLTLVSANEYTSPAADGTTQTTSDDHTTYPSQVANNQGNTTIQYVGDTTTDITTGDSTTDTDGTVTKKNNGKQVYGLTLTAVPSFDFGTKNWISTTETATADGVTTKPTGDTSESNTPSSIYVRDNRGGTTGYKVYASASSLYNANGKELPVSSLKLTVADGTANKNGGLITGSTDTEIYQNTDKTNAKASAATFKDLLGGGTQATDYFGRIAGYGNLLVTGNDLSIGDNATGAVSAKLVLKNNQVQAATSYTGVITYTLQDATITSSTTN